MVSIDKAKDGTATATYTYNDDGSEVTDKDFLANGGAIIDEMIQTRAGRRIIKRVQKNEKSAHYNLEEEANVVPGDSRDKKQRGNNYLELGVTEDPYDAKKKVMENNGVWEITVNAGSMATEKRALVSVEGGGKKGEPYTHPSGDVVILVPYKEKRRPVRNRAEGIASTGGHESKHFLNDNIRGEGPSNSADRKITRELRKRAKKNRPKNMPMFTGSTN